MAKFIWLGLTARGELLQHDLMAEDHNDARQQATRQARALGVHVVEIRALNTRTSAWLRGRILLTSLFQRSRFDLLLFSCELLALLRAGLALTEALETLNERARQPQNKRASDEKGQHVLAGLTLLMQQGKSCSSAMASYPDHFSALFIAMLAASEQTGEMPQALDRYIQYHAQTSLIRQKLISASLYPAMLLLAGTLVAFFLICFLAPRFGRVYEGMTQVELPLLSLWLIKLGLFISTHVFSSAASLIIAFAGGASVALQPGVQQHVLMWLRANIWIGGQLKLTQMTRFYRSVGMLLNGGVPLLSSLQMTGDLLEPSLKTGLMRSMRNISQGKTLSESLHQEGLLTPIAFRLLRAGERNGQIADMLEQTALFHEREINQWVERFSRLIEPVLMLVMGLGIGMIVVLLYLPIFDMAGSLQ
ncbi:type II secretion system F family protein [Paraburkholderia azotifigens]|uniref:type II secretion system F family protein n=1 Tax=Paraburkholderia azotifigens TaxID=2057004 RepID=UPI00316E605F